MFTVKRVTSVTPVTGAVNDFTDQDLLQTGCMIKITIILVFPTDVTGLTGSVGSLKGCEMQQSRISSSRY